MGNSSPKPSTSLALSYRLELQAPWNNKLTVALTNVDKSKCVELAAWSANQSLKIENFSNFLQTDAKTLAKGYYLPLFQIAAQKNLLFMLTEKKNNNIIGVICFLDLYQRKGEVPWHEKIKIDIGYKTFDFIMHETKTAGYIPNKANEVLMFVTGLVDYNLRNSGLLSRVLKSMYATHKILTEATIIWPDINGRIDLLALKGIHNFFTMDFQSFLAIKGLEPLSVLPQFHKTGPKARNFRIFVTDRRPRPKL